MNKPTDQLSAVEKLQLATRISQMVLAVLEKGEYPLVLMTARLSSVPGVEEGGALEGFGEAWIADRTPETVELVTLAHEHALKGFEEAENSYIQLQDPSKN